VNLSSYGFLRVAFLIGLVLALLATLLSGCAAGTDEPRSQTAGDSGSANEELTVLTAPEEGRPAYESPVEVLVTRDDTSLPRGCRPWDVAGLLSTFLEAFNKGDQERLAMFFAVEPDLITPPWLYASSLERGEAFRADTVEELLAHFAERHNKQEKMRLVKVEVGVQPAYFVDEPVGSPRSAGSEDSIYAGITYILTREADDIGPGRLQMSGKAGINCETQTFYNWSMGVNGSFEGAPGPCGKLPPQWKREEEDLVIACAR
jgi:hypothetical protein